MSSDKRREPHERRKETKAVKAVDDELSQSLSRARNLRHEAQPERDLWPQVARRIADIPLVSVRHGSNEGGEGGLAGWLAGLRQRFGLPVLGGLPGLVALALLCLLLVLSSVSATLWWTGQRSGPLAQRGEGLLPPGSVAASDLEARRIADALRVRDGVAEVHESLLAILDERRGELPPQTVAALEQNLAIIDHAIAEIYLAMGDRADGHILNLLLAETYRREADLLRQLEWWSPTPEEKNS